MIILKKMLSNKSLIIHSFSVAMVMEEYAKKIDENIDFGGARKTRTSPSNSMQKTTLHVGLFSCLYDRKLPKTLPAQVGTRSRMSIHNCMYARILTS